ncbi:MAG TPA: ferrous iron transport protein B [Anaerolineales bacterium]|nr:ferrous iron transport protein B [Anaerolineales bacterium]
MSCHDQEGGAITGRGAIALVGNPNVGKSVVFHRLTGRYAAVSNYPGTTVEVARGPALSLDGTIVDTPGLLMLPAHSEEERVAARVLLQDSLRVLVQVGDAKNLRRTLLLTVQLAEMGVPLVVALNMMDEAAEHGLNVHPEALAEGLGVEVIPTVATRGRGMAELERAIALARPATCRVVYPSPVEAELTFLADRLPQASISPRSLALLWICEDDVVDEWLRVRLPDSDMQILEAARDRVAAACDDPAAEVVQRARLAWIDRLASAATHAAAPPHRRLLDTLGRLSVHPVWGWPVLGIVLAGLYGFVGVFGAQTLVGWLEGRLFGEVVNPWLASLASRWIPIGWVADLLVGPYGLWTMGVTYALALILPIVSTFFLAFGLMEDSGYLPRLAVLSHRGFRLIGLNGKAVLPMVLGLGCVTTATLTTRILETRRERLLAILLLALAVPCSAQLGVVMGMLGAVSVSATLIWAGVVVAVLLLVGWLAAKLVPGERSALLIEIPPLRRPVASNVLIKTAARLEWYLREVLPLFLIGSVLVFLLDRTGLLAVGSRLAEPVVTGWLGLPPEATLAFVLGFLRRDFGATGLFALQSHGLLSPLQTVVSMVTITLFIPCLAAILMMARERGWRTTLAISAFVFPFAFAVGGILRLGLQAVGWT